jgi:hypothetical protein
MLKISALTPTYLAFKTFGGVYASSRKEPDQCILPTGCKLPSLVVESGWAESCTDLLRDKELWLNGGAGSVTVVIVIKWSKVSGNMVQGGSPSVRQGFRHWGAPNPSARGSRPASPSISIICLFFLSLFFPFLSGFFSSSDY